VAPTVNQVSSLQDFYAIRKQATRGVSVIYETLEKHALPPAIIAQLNYTQWVPPADSSLFVKIGLMDKIALTISVIHIISYLCRI
jgi:hypothetical protein